ncbi:MAG TPA: PQQ-binding-like beta-propeller repeat protein, partial [Candidatus Paceibacterota bacterium]
MTLGALLVLAGCNTGSTPANTLITPTVPAASHTLSATNPSASSPSPLATNTTSPAASTNSAAAGADWPTYHRDNARTGYLPDMPDPQQLTVAWNTPLDGAVYAEPLVVGGHLIVATENNSLYSLNADTGQVEWQTNIGNP